MGDRSKVGAAFALIAALSVGAPISAQAAETPDVEFDGSGWGHGVGMSQYGAYAMDTLGYDYTDILGYYYLGTAVEIVDPNTTIWVNLERDFSSKTLTVLTTGGGTPTDVSVTSGSGSGSAVVGATIAISSVGTTGCLVQIANPSETPIDILDTTECSVDLSWYDWNTPGSTPTTKIQIEGCTLADWNTPGGTVYRSCQYGRGILHLRQGPGGLDLSLQVLLNDYVLGISEMPYAWPSESLKAQAVAARSYAEARRITRGTPGANGCAAWCHIKDTAVDQRYVGWGHSQNGSWIAATNDTNGEILTHDDSSIDVITAFYTSSSGGATEFGHEVGYSNSPVEWLTSVDDTWAVDGTVFNPNASWTKTVPADQVAAAAELDLLTAMTVSGRRPGSNSVAELKLTGISGGDVVVIYKPVSWARTAFSLKSSYFDVDFEALPEHILDSEGDEILLYRNDGVFQYNSLLSDGGLGALINEGSNYTVNWKSITSIDLDADGQDEIMFYRDDGLYRYYQIHPDGNVGSPIQAGDEYTHGWDSITAVDLDGDGQDEIFFYRDDGLYRYYNIASNGRIGSPISSGDEYTHGWDSISAVDLDGDGQDEMFFYRSDGLYRYYNIRPDGTLPSPTLAGSDYPTGWDTITAADLDGDGQDEMLFYKEDGSYEFYNVQSDGFLGDLIDSGSDFGSRWSVVAPINLDGQ